MCTSASKHTSLPACQADSAFPLQASQQQGCSSLPGRRTRRGCPASGLPWGSGAPEKRMPVQSAPAGSEANARQLARGGAMASTMQAGRIRVTQVGRRHRSRPNARAGTCHTSAPQPAPNAAGRPPAHANMPTCAATTCKCRGVCIASKLTRPHQVPGRPGRAGRLVGQLAPHLHSEVGQ